MRYPLCQSVDGSLHGMLTADTETFRVYADIISKGVSNLQIKIGGCLLVFTHCQALSTHSAVLGHLLDMVIHSCNYIHVHLLQQPY